MYESTVEASSIFPLPDSPGPELGAVLSGINSSALSRYERVQVIAACQKLISHYLFYREIAALYDQELAEEPEIPIEDSAWAVRTELGAALHLSNRGAEIEFERALLLARAQGVGEALSRGAIDLYRAQVLVDHTCHLPDQDLCWVIEQVIDEAAGLTAGQIRVRVERLCYLASPEDSRLRYGEAVEKRYVAVRGNEFGTAILEGRDLPPDRAESAYRRLTLLAGKLRRQGERRTMDQLRADLLLDLLLGEAESAGKGGGKDSGSVDLLVDLETLAGLAEAPGELLGFGPVISDLCRQVASRQRHSRWTFTVTDPVSGMPIYSGVTRRRPATGVRREVMAQNPHCIFPGCRMPAIRCDLDHRQMYSEGGSTTRDNLVSLCRRHHLARHRLGWRHQPLPRGDHLWTSPLGHRYTTSGRSP